MHYSEWGTPQFKRGSNDGDKIMILLFFIIFVVLPGIVIALKLLSIKW